MAIYHLTVGVVSRARGQSVVAAAAYRSGSRLRDARYGGVHDYSGKRRVAHSEILAPEDAPGWARDRESLWNRVEAAEPRRDSQLARTLELALPIELTRNQWISLMREFVVSTFIAEGMIADLSLLDDNPRNPTVKMLLTLRCATAEGFGRKVRRWNGRSTLLGWRSTWATLVNRHLARAGHGARIDHRSLDAQQVELTPARHWGLGGGRNAAAGLPAHLVERMHEQRRIARENGAVMLEDPLVALRALTQGRPEFTRADLVQFLRSRTDGPSQLAGVCRAVARCEDLVALESVGGLARFTSRDRVEAEKFLLSHAATMRVRRGHGVGPTSAAAVTLPDELRRAYQYLVEDCDFRAWVALPTEAQAVIGAARHAWEAAGLSVLDAGPPGSDCPAPGRRSVLVVRSVEMRGVKELERMLALADRARAKAVLIGDSAVLRALPLESPVRRVLRESGLPAIMEA